MKQKKVSKTSKVNKKAKKLAKIKEEAVNSQYFAHAPNRKGTI